MSEIVIQIINPADEGEVWTAWEDGRVTRHLRFIPGYREEGELEVIAKKRFDITRDRLIQIMQEHSGKIGRGEVDLRGRWLPPRSRKKVTSATHFSRKDKK